MRAFAGLTSCAVLAFGCKHASQLQHADASVDAAPPIMLTMPGGSPFAISVDAAFAYFTLYGGGVYRVAIGGGIADELAPTDAFARALTLDAQRVYWTDHAHVGAVDRAGGSPQQIAPGMFPSALAVEQAHIYWIDFDSGTVNRAALDGSASTVLTTVDHHQYGAITALAIDDSALYWLTQGAASNPGTVSKLSFAGGPVVPLATGLANPGGMVVYQGDVYWAGYQDGNVSKVSTLGGSVTVFATQQSLPGALAVDDTGVYWVNAGTPEAGFADGSVNHVALSGGDVTTLASNQSEPAGIATDASAIYWTNYRDGTIMKLSR
jgi:hypothetical protein